MRVSVSTYGKVGRLTKTAVIHSNDATHPAVTLIVTMDVALR